MNSEGLLKPCPLCGNEVELFEVQYTYGYIERIEIECRCGLQATICSDDYYLVNGKRRNIGLNAIAKWNRRVNNNEADNDSM